MKIFILNCAYNDDRGAVYLADPEVYKTREEALAALKDECDALESKDCEVELDLDSGIADVYEFDNYSTYKITEVEV